MLLVQYQSGTDYHLVPCHRLCSAAVSVMLLSPCTKLEQVLAGILERQMLLIVCAHRRRYDRPLAWPIADSRLQNNS